MQFNKEDMAKKCATNKDAMHKRITLQSDLSSLTDTKRAKQVSQTNRVRFQGKCLLPLNNEHGSHRRILLIWWHQSEKSIQNNQSKFLWNIRPILWDCYFVPLRVAVNMMREAAGADVVSHKLPSESEVYYLWPMSSIESRYGLHWINSLSLTTNPT